MFALAVCTLALAAAQTVEVRIAPDQPAPLFFTDEPLVVQIRSTTKLTAAPHIEAELPDGRRISWDPGKLNLAPGRARWLTMEGLPVLRGPHVFHIRTSDSAAPVQRALVRIDRPAAAGPRTAVFALSTPSPAMRYAAQCLGAGLQFPLEWPTLDAEVTAFALPDRGPAYVKITASGGRHPRTIESAAAALSTRVNLWTVTGTKSSNESLREAQAIRDGDAAARWAVRVDNAREAADVLDSAAANPPVALVCAPKTANEVAGVSARLGYEHMPLLIDLSANGVEPLPALLLASLIDPARAALVPQQIVEMPEGFTSALAVLSAMRSLLIGAQSLGPYSVAGANEAWTFRLGPQASPDSWMLIVLVRDPAAPLPAIVPGEGAVWNLLDAYGNSLGDAGREGNRIAVPAHAGAWYARGHGGTLLRDALAARIRALAASASDYAGDLAAVAPDTVGSLEALTKYSLPQPARLHFFSLLRALPTLEEGWRRGLLETRAAVPMMRDFTDIAAAIAVLEQEIDEPLLEPLDKTLDTCADLAARFPAITSNDPRSALRLTFLRDEVARLTAASRGWKDAGRPTEAKAVAAIAEWRARCLEAAATVAWPADEEEPAAQETPAPDAAKDESDTPSKEEP